MADPQADIKRWPFGVEADVDSDTPLVVVQLQGEETRCSSLEP